MAQAVIAHAEADGRLRPGGSVVEYTGGSTGASLALICAAKGYPLQVVTSRAFSEDKLVQMAALGARLVLVESESGKYTKALFLEMIETARKIKAETGAFWTDQLNNADAVTGYYGLGEEIWRQSEGIVDAFVQSIGTGASLSGVQAVLKRYNPGVQIVGVEPAESAVLSGGPPGAHKIEGIGIGFPPPLWNPDLAGQIVPVSTDDAEAMARRLASEEGLFAGTSSGANVVAAIRTGMRLGPNASVATLLVDSGLKYVTTKVYQLERSDSSPALR